MVWKLIRITIELIIYVGQGLYKDIGLCRHVCIVFWPNPPIAILESPNCLSYGWLTFLKRCHWLAGQENNLHKPEQNIDNDLYCNSNEFPNHLFH